MKNDSYVLRHEQCPKCREVGNDRSGDNLAVYSDGHQYCFKCGYISGNRSITKPIVRIEKEIILPSDITTDIPSEPLQWLQQYRLARLDIQKHHIFWSDKWSRLIFPYFDDTGLIAWQGRYIGKETDKAKWFSQGKIHEILHPINVNNGEAVLVEDIISAIAVSKVKGAIPIFGSTISNKQFLRIKTLVGKVYLWLDPDMRSKSLKMAFTGRLLGLDVQVIYSDKDPKEYTTEEIDKILNM